MGVGGGPRAPPRARSLRLPVHGRFKDPRRAAILLRSVLSEHGGERLRRAPHDPGVTHVTAHGRSVPRQQRRRKDAADQRGVGRHGEVGGDDELER